MNMRYADYPKHLPQAELRQLILVAQCPIASLSVQAKKAQAKVVLHNMRLVCSVAKRWAKSLDLEDLVQEGALALAHCITKFNLNRVGRSGHVQFSTFAAWVIRHHYCLIYRKVNKHRAQEWVSSDWVADIHTSAEDVMTDYDQFWEPSDKTGQPVSHRRLASAMACLDSRQRLVLEELSSDERPTLESLSHSYKITRERVRQIEMKGLKQLAKLLGADPSRVKSLSRI